MDSIVDLCTYCHFTISDDVDVKDNSVLKEITDTGFGIKQICPLKIECQNPTVAQINNLSSILRLHIERRVYDDDFSIVGEKVMDCFDKKTSERKSVIAEKKESVETPLDDCNRPESVVTSRQSDFARSERTNDNNFQESRSYPNDDQRQNLCDRFPLENLVLDSKDSLSRKEIVRLSSKYEVTSQICVETKVKEEPGPLHFTAEQGKQKTVETCMKPVISHGEESRDGKLFMENPITHDVVGLTRSSANELTTLKRAMPDLMQSNYAINQVDEEVSNFGNLKNSNGKCEDHGAQEVGMGDDLYHGFPSLDMKDKGNSQSQRYSFFGEKTEQNVPPTERKIMLPQMTYRKTHLSGSSSVSAETRDKAGAGTDKIITSLDTSASSESGITSSMLLQRKPSDILAHPEICDASCVMRDENMFLSPSTHKYAVRYFDGSTVEEILNHAEDLGAHYLIKRSNYGECHHDLELLQKFCIDQICYDEKDKNMNDTLKVLQASDLIYEVLKGCIILAGLEDDVKLVKIKLLSFLGNQHVINRKEGESLSESTRIDYGHGSRSEKGGNADRRNAFCSSTLNPKRTDQGLVPSGARPKSRGTVHTSFNQSDWHMETSGGVLSFSKANCATKVTVLKEDITKLQVDCIVNAANKKLNNSKGVARVIALAAGDTLQKECNGFIAAGNTLDVGGVFVSTGGKLPSKKVLHAVGPRWEESQPATRCAKFLRQTVIRCLVEAQSLRMKSVALPSISAAVFKVPKEICAESYLKAAKHFLIYQEVMHMQTLRKIVFVDIVADMVNFIQEYFKQHWDLPLNNDEMNGDYEFIACLLHKQDEATREEYKQQSIVKRRETYSSVHPSAPAGCSAYYKIGSIKINVSVKHAASCGGDLIILLGEMFDEFTRDLSTDNPLKCIEKLHGSFELCSLHSQFGDSLLCKLLPAPNSKHKLESAFANFGEAIEFSEMKGKRSVDVKTVVVTGSFLYKDNRTSRMLSGRFGRLMYDEALRLIKQQSTSVERVVIATSKQTESLVTIIFDSQEGCKKISEMNQPVKEVECVICCEVTENINRLPCCGKKLCMQCQSQVARCPFCQKIFGILTGNQPHGSMTWNKIFDRSSLLPPWTSVYQIYYSLPSGTQQEEHQNPGVPYSGTTRKAYLPYTKEGFRVLQLLQIAFMRRLTFTIATSSTTGKENTVVWNGIHHKTQLSGLHGYPDPDYLQRVTKELEQRGVTFSNMTKMEERKLDCSIIET